MKKYNSGIDYLTNEIKLIELEQNKKEINNNKIYNIITYISVIILCTLSKNIFISLIGLSVILSKNSIKLLIDNIKNKFSSNNEYNEFMLRKINKSYYNEEYKNLIENASYETTDERKFRKAIEQQQMINTNKLELNKNETMKQIIYELDVLYDTYNLADLNISNNEWDYYFNNLYKFFVKNKIEKKFYPYTSSIIRIILAKSLINNAEEITIEDLKDGLNYLSLYNDIQKEDIKEMQEKIGRNKIIRINDYKRKLKR